MVETYSDMFSTPLEMVFCSLEMVFCSSETDFCYSETDFQDSETDFLDSEMVFLALEMFFCPLEVIISSWESRNFMIEVKNLSGAEGRTLQDYFSVLYLLITNFRVKEAFEFLSDNLTK